MARFISLFAALLLPITAYGQETTKLEVQTSDVVDVTTQKQEVIENRVPLVVPEQTTSAKSNVEKISVTGSRIKRIDVEGPSPVLTLDKEFLEKSGYNSVSDVLRDTTVSSFGVERADSDETNSVGASSIGLRGLGADRTLVLLDGRRLPKIDGGNAVDLNLIPFSAIERIEILKDGASAIYGSDALAGVINFITKKDFDGGEVKTRYSQPELNGGTRQEISATYGKSYSKGNFLAVYQYRNNGRIMDQDRPWSRGAVSGYGSPGTTLKVGDKNAKWQAMASCPPERVRTFPDGSSDCTFDYSVYTSGLPDVEQHSSMLRGDYDIAGDLNAFATATYTRRQVRWQWAPSADDFNNSEKVGGGNYTIPSSVATKAGVSSIGGDFDMRYRTVNELGARVSRDTTNSVGAVVGLRGEMFDSWDWETSVNHGLSELNNLRHGGYGDKRALYQAMLEGRMKPFANSNEQTFLTEASRVGDQLIRSNVTSAQMVSSGELGELLGVNLVMSTGVSATWESYRVTVDEVTATGNLFGGIGESGQGQRNYQSVFSELGMTVGPVEVQLAGRFDNYSDFGGTINPKFSVRYAPFKSVIFRGSVGTGFRAPSLDELYSTSNYRYPWFADTQACATVGGSFCEEQQYRVFSGGNPNLKEETSFSYNIGTVIQPTKNFSIALDLWETTVENAVGLDFNDLMLAESRLGPSALEQQGVFVNRRNGLIEEIIAPNLNLARQQSRGLELAMGYTIRAGRWNIRPQMDHSHLLENQEEIFPGLGFRNKLGEVGRPEWKNTSAVNIGFRRHGLRLAARTIAGQYKVAHLSDPTNTARLATYTEYDTHYDYSADWGGQFSFGVKNLLGSNRPLDDSAGFSNRFNAQLYDPIGRLYYMGYAQTF